MSLQKEIIDELQVSPEIAPEVEIINRVDLLKMYAKATGMKGFVLGISGGQDSSLAGKLAQMAVQQLREETGDEYTFVAVRLPYGVQHDEDDAQQALRFIQPDRSVTVNIKGAVDASFRSFKEATGEELSDFLKGNTKARERMKVQYDLAAHYRLIVIGTDHAAEAATGFFTKHGDGACDIAPLFGLNKRQGKQLLRELGSPESLYKKVPTADLEEERPGFPDEEALGITYDEIDDYLEGKEIKRESKQRLESHYLKTRHKREKEITLYTDWWKK
ncbi:ammonia-dependent NAD(+) synthetase [Alkalihalobacillus sp. AL-G]|uniref:ammonia-dependent NAD(+) synthetase n=1 Tax=Alkalihalobacillus sp. AL-G TaxID=2926399 RepID=UPI00272B3F28|nr:ammonia-dependent NAD(+) synthetase [Alkalihalobacillus sp. AL-G]WLD93629.1 ammonia-dependent NAD(+) synthetase [Alkalihalobacillus sp. AL-G]